MQNYLLIGFIAWLFPGGGHLMQKKWTRGAIIAVVFWTMVVVAVLSGGSYYPGFGFNEGQLLYILNFFARFGSGLGALVGFATGTGSATKAAALATFEYGGRFLEVAGLLNFLAVIDAVDIFLGRKK